MTREKVINVQKKAQSLEQFQRRAAGEDASTLKTVFLVLGLVVAGVASWGAWSIHQSRASEAFETRLAGLQMEVEGDGLTPVAPEVLQGRMQAALPRLEALVKEAPSADRPQAAGLLATWKLMLTGQGGVPAATDTPWGRLREAQRLTALGQGKEAKALLDPIRAKATPETLWGETYWLSLLEVDRLNGDRAQAFKDLSDFRTRFKNADATSQMAGMINSI